MAKTRTKPHTTRTPPPEDEIYDPIDFEPKTPIGFALRAARRKIIAAGIPMLSDEEFERELAERRGGLPDHE